MTANLQTPPRPAPRSAANAAARGTRLLVSCKDRPGIVAALSRFLHERDANILASDQHTTDPDGGTFFIRSDLERLVLVRAVKLHLEDRVIVHQNRTVVFQ